MIFAAEAETLRLIHFNDQLKCDLNDIEKHIKTACEKGNWSIYYKPDWLDNVHDSYFEINAFNERIDAILKVLEMHGYKAELISYSLYINW